jgi:Spy/CpxP family protein refolding chaperone
MKIRTSMVISLLICLAGTSFGQKIHFATGHARQVTFLDGDQTVVSPLDDALDGVKKALKLTDTQVTAVKALLNLKDNDTKTALQELSPKLEALQTVLAQQNPSAVEIGNAYLAVRTAENRLKAIQDKFQIDFQALLTPDQSTTLTSLKNAAEGVDALRRFGLIGEGGPFGMALAGPGVRALGFAAPSFASDGVK